MGIVDYVAEELNDNYTAAVFVYYNTGYQGFYHEKTGMWNVFRERYVLSFKWHWAAEITRRLKNRGSENTQWAVLSGLFGIEMSEFWNTEASVWIKFMLQSRDGWWAEEVNDRCEV